MSDLEPVGLWRGHERYACPHCPFDTFVPARMAEHLAMDHPPETQRPKLVNENEAARQRPAPKPPRPPLVNENEPSKQPVSLPRTRRRKDD